MSAVPNIGGLDLAQMKQLVEQIPVSKTGIDMEVTGVKLSWGAGITDKGETLFVLRIQNHDETWGVRIPMQEPYLNQKLREVEEIKKNVVKAKEQWEAQNGSDRG